MCTFVRSFLAVAILLLSGCAQLPPRPELPPDSALATGSQSTLDSKVGTAEARHPGQSGFGLLTDGRAAFAARAQTAHVAVRSLDVQTYIWHSDMTGRFLAQQLVDAADRGVRVRLLLDDLDVRDRNRGLLALDAHPNIEVRVFNPLASRSGTLAKLGEYLTSMQRLNHRMHNKSWIADNRVAFVGGRNLGNEYFGAGDETNFVDLDFALVGPVVRDVSASFDRYWNSRAAYPVTSLTPEAVTAESLARLRADLAAAVEATKHSVYAEMLRRDDAIERLLIGDWPLQWSGEFRFVADDPLKALKDPGAGRSDVLGLLVPAMKAAQVSVTLISPYFVPGKDGAAGLVRGAQSGKRVRILTNSLAANDVAAVHGGYAAYRKELLLGGVLLWELKPEVGAKTESSLFGSSGASLHTKALTVDHRLLFVGSFNLDPRSTSLNCEQGVLVTDPELARQFEQIFATQTSGSRAWSVTLKGGDLTWSDGNATYDSEPLASAFQRFQAWGARLLPVESQL
jgi:putative cardiolipin synthase